MRLLTLLACLCICCPAANADPRRADVTVRQVNGDLRVSYQLDQLVTNFDFQTADVVRSADMTVLTPGLTLADDAISSADPFNSFDLLVRATTRERDAKYPIYYRVGAGGVLYTPAFNANPDRWQTRLNLITEAGEVIVGETANRGAVFIGPASHVKDLPFTQLVSAPDLPDWVRLRAIDSLGGSLAYLTDSLGVGLAHKPVLVLSWDKNGSGTVADVSPGSFIGYRLHGDMWSTANPAALDELNKVMLHESFHFWNGGLATHRHDAPTWLHEGGADYVALLTGLHLDLIDDDEMQRSLGEALSKCRQALAMAKEPALKDVGFLPSQIRYPCGAIFQWSIDLKVRRDSGGRRTILDVWKQVIAAAQARENKEYGLADFYNAAALPTDGSFQPIALLEQVSGSERWADLKAALIGLGAKIEAAPDAESRRTALIFHLLDQVCRDGPRGFHTDNGKITLDSSSSCGVLGGDPELLGILGSSPSTLTGATYSEASSRCAAGLGIDVELVGPKTVNVPCREPLAAALDVYVVKAWRP